METNSPLVLLVDDEVAIQSLLSDTVVGSDYRVERG